MKTTSLSKHVTLAMASSTLMNYAIKAAAELASTEIREETISIHDDDGKQIDNKKVANLWDYLVGLVESQQFLPDDFLDEISFFCVNFILTLPESEFSLLWSAFYSLHPDLATADNDGDDDITFALAAFLLSELFVLAGDSKAGTGVFSCSAQQAPKSDSLN